MPQLPYVTLNVFTTQPLTSGNPLAVVTIPPNTTISKTQEHLIAREFGYSETIFIYPSSSLRPEQQNEGYTKIAIWTVAQEIPFAGHPTVGAGWVLGEEKKEGEILIPAGRLKYEKDVNGRVRIDTPHKVTLWGRTVSKQRIGEVIGLPYEAFGNDEEKVFENSTVGVAHAKDVFVKAGDEDGWDVNGIPVVSIVDGMTFALVEVKSVSVLQALKVGRKDVVLDMVNDLGAVIPPGGRSFIGVYCYTILEEDVRDGKGTVKVRSRMFFRGDGEDPATGSAACALGSYLGIVKGSAAAGDKGVGEWEFEVTQGVEMGRRSDIGVRVLLDEVDGEGRRGVRKVYLEGEAVKVMEGVLTV
ncbi:hypothetical protein TWF506_009016 [Arthrobotrys conoides]|uniref:Diaminopimelate epimerase-like protein n=1 Tax=Arthrobotrys conoides TaxID=74498 RepID=A0AAN8RWS2_9PEZI